MKREKYIRSLCEAKEGSLVILRTVGTNITLRMRRVISVTKSYLEVDGNFYRLDGSMVGAKPPSWTYLCAPLQPIRGKSQETYLDKFRREQFVITRTKRQLVRFIRNVDYRGVPIQQLRMAANALGYQEDENANDRTLAD